MSYDFYRNGIGNPLHPENQKEQERTFEDVIEVLFKEDKEIVLNHIETIEYKANQKHLGFKTRCEMALEKLTEIENFSLETENSYLNSKIKSIIKILTP